MDKGFFKIWFLCIPHRMRYLLWMVRAWSSVSPIFSSLIMSRASSSYVCSFQSLLKVITSFWHTFLAWMNPMILGGHSRWLSPLLHSLLLLLPLQDVMHSGSSHSSTVSIFLSSNSLIKESNIFGVFREDTCGTSWSVIESTVILALIKFFLCRALRLISL